MASAAPDTVTLPSARRCRLRQSFDRAAANFDDVATLPREIAARMNERLALMRLPVHAILDAGCGTGHDASLLRHRYRGALIVELDFSENMLRQRAVRRNWLRRWTTRVAKRSAVCADVAQLPLAAASIDLVWSNLALHWVEDLTAVLGEMHRALRPGGLLMFSALGPDTLQELRTATAGDGFGVNQQLDMHDIGDMLVHCGYADPVMDMERITLTYADVDGLLRDLKMHGSVSLAQPQQRGLGARRHYRRMRSRYEQFRRDDKRVPATFEVIYGHAWKPQARTSPTGRRVIDIRSARR